MKNPHTKDQLLTPLPCCGKLWRKSLSTNPKPLTGIAADRNRNLLLFCRQGRAARLKLDPSGIQPDREQKPENEACKGELNVKKRKGNAQFRQKRASQKIFVEWQEK